MRRAKHPALPRTFLLPALGLCLLAGVAAAKAKAKTIHIGMVDSYFRYTRKSDIKKTSAPFRKLMESQTGLRGQVVPGGNPLELGAKLNADEFQLGVFHGFEFAWAQEKYPELRPLMIAVNRHRLLRALILVKKDSPATGLASLRGKSVAIADETREHCWLYLERSCQKEGKTASQYFSRIVVPSNAEIALDDVVAGRVDAALLDQAALDAYQRRNPQRFGRLKVIEKSGTFPATVVAYHKGALDKKTLQTFKTGMLNARKTTYGRQMLALNHLTHCEKVPKDYQATLARVAKAYPPPTSYGEEKK